MGEPRTEPTTFPSMPALAPAPDIYRDVAEVDYRRWCAWNQSTLKDLGEWDNYTQQLHPAPMKSPAHVRAALDCPHEPTDDQTFGLAYHCLLLEPGRFAREYKALKRPIDKRTTAGKAEWAAMCAEYGAGKILTAQDWELLKGMAAAAAAHEKTKRLIGCIGEREVSLVWIDQGTGEKCKARIDKLAVGTKSDGSPVHALIDLKSTRCAHWRDFEKDAARYGYHIQAAMYSDGYEALTGARPAYYILAQEKVAPFQVICYQVKPETIHSGRVIYRAQLELAKRCRDENRWPGYADDRVVELDLPAWAVADKEDDGIGGGVDSVQGAEA